MYDDPPGGSGGNVSGNVQLLSPKRPAIMDRGWTEAGPAGMASPAIVTMDIDDPFARVSLTLLYVLCGDFTDVLWLQEALMRANSS